MQQLDAPAPDDQQKTLLDTVNALYRQKRKMLVFFILVMVAVALFTFVPSPEYRSEANLLVRVGRDNVFLEATSTTGRIASIGQSRESELNSELALLRSRDLAEQLVDALGPDVILGDTPPSATDDGPQPTAASLDDPDVAPAPPAARKAATPEGDLAVVKVMKNLGVELVKGSNVIARLALQKLVRLYLEKHIQAYRASGSYQFFVEQTEHAKATLEGAEAEYQQLKNRTGVASMDDQRRITLGELGSQESEMGRIRADISASKSKIASMQALMSAPPDDKSGARDAVSNPATDDLRRKLAALAVEEEELLSKFQPESSRVIEVRDKIARMTDLLNHAIHEQLSSDIYAETQHLQSLEAKLGTISLGAGTERNKRDALINVETRLSQLEREISIDTANYREYSQKLEQARIGIALERERISNISVTQEPTLPIDPFRPQKALNLALGFLIALFGSLGVGFVAEFFDHMIRMPADVDAKLGLRTLVTLPVLPKESVDPLVHADPAGLPRGGGPREGATRVSSSDWVVHQDAKSYYDVLQSRMFVYGNGELGPPGVIAVTSCYRGEGVSVVASNLAAMLADTLHGPVLLVDARAAQDYVAEQTVSFSTSLMKAGDDRATRQLDVHRPREAQNSFVELKSVYRFIVIDAPAALNDMTALRLAGHVDGVVLVIESGRVRWEVARQAVGLLRHANARLIGVVLNKRQDYLPNWLYRRL
jgi:succinoglycan biosynthesis transport protein ExoP